MDGRTRSVTMREVAQHAGVSSSTVSRALSGSRAMSAEIRDRVLRSAEALGYEVNLLGRALRQQRLDVVGLILPDFSNPFFTALAEQLGAVFREAGFELLVSSAGNDLGIERRAVSSFLGRQIHALVVIPSDEAASRAALDAASRRVPTVQFDRRVADSDAPYVGCDNRIGVELIVRHVREVTPPGEPVVFVGAGTASSSARERREAFAALMPEALILDGSFDVAWGHRAARELLDRGIAGATVVASADVIALGLQSELQAAGRRVPGDFRVIGFDGVGVADYALPALTTVRQPVEAMSRAILELITRDDPATPAGTVLVAPDLVLGDSSRTASGRAARGR
ncbi:LacI family transcriptional regulator [Leucobacter allii]|uniref:LacI family DNA-binding transcriptional regulator n=1 Tax=Leucobacter allii TaxID=2932247 RepID=UPI001FD2708D|nr:LacI family DNA-binding transcriptional regulator [Leucobacter allii]UOR00575.1 LacI family transcriptional regulator [Leucobacter allii]